MKKKIHRPTPILVPGAPPKLKPKAEPGPTTKSAKNTKAAPPEPLNN